MTRRLDDDIDLGNYRLRIFEGSASWSVWLSDNRSNLDGCCFAIGTTRDAAVSQAVELAEAIEAALQAATLSRD